jgi:hypothetical protein
MALMRRFGRKGNEATESWRGMHNEELHNLYSSPSVIRIIKTRKMKWEGYVARIVGNRNIYEILMVKPEGKWLLRRPRYRWVDNIKMNLVVVR